MTQHDEATTDEKAERKAWVFRGESVMELYERLSIIGPNVAVLRVTQRGGTITLNTIGDGYDGPEINEVTPCPGAPGCP